MSLDPEVDAVAVAPRYSVVWPQSSRGVAARRVADRLPDLAGRRIGFLWDYVFRGDELFPVLREHLQARFDGLEVIDYEQFGNSHGGDEAAFVDALPQALHDHRVDAVVSGVGC